MLFLIWKRNLKNLIKKPQKFKKILKSLRNQCRRILKYKIQIQFTLKEYASLFKEMKTI